MSGIRVVIVTAASRGIGAAVSRHLAKEGYCLSLMSRSDHIREIASETGGLGLRGSISEPNDLSQLVHQTLENFGRLDGVVCNSGNTARGPLLGVSDEEWEEGARLILMNVIRMARLTTPFLIEAGGGSIVNISSFAAANPSLRFPVSSVLRPGVSAFAKLYTREYAQYGIRMNNILPGLMENSPRNSNLVEHIPARRLGTMHEIASTTS